MASIDEEKKKEFDELQLVLMENASKIGQTMQQIRVKEGEKQRARLTRSELEGLSEDVTLYRSLGRSFVRAARPDLVNEIDEARLACEEELERLEHKRRYCEKKMGEVENQLRELLTHSPSLARAVANASR